MTDSDYNRRSATARQDSRRAPRRAPQCSSPRCARVLAAGALLGARRPLASSRRYDGRSCSPPVRDHAERGMAARRSGRSPRRQQLRAPAAAARRPSCSRLLGLSIAEGQRLRRPTAATVAVSGAGCGAAAARRRRRRRRRRRAARADAHDESLFPRDAGPPSSRHELGTTAKRRKNSTRRCATRRAGERQERADTIEGDDRDG